MARFKVINAAPCPLNVNVTGVDFTYMTLGQGKVRRQQLGGFNKIGQLSSNILLLSNPQALCGDAVFTCDIIGSLILDSINYETLINIMIPTFPEEGIVWSILNVF